MKKLTGLILAWALILGMASNASAIQFKGKGMISNAFEYASNNKFANKEAGDRNDDEFLASERIRLQLSAIASESLSGVVYFEVGDIVWGQAKTGGALGADATIIELKSAYLDWEPPAIDLKVRMGIQGMALPLMASKGNFVLDDDAAGIVANYKVNENVAVTGMWARLLNDNPLDKGEDKVVDNTVFIHDSTRTYNGDRPDHDAFDFFSLILPLNFEGLKISPWVGFSAMGDGIGRNPNKNYDEGFVKTSRKKLQEGMGVYTGEGSKPVLLEYGGGETYTWWGGLSASLTAFDPIRIKFDFIYGNKQGNGTYSNTYYSKNNGEVAEIQPGALARGMHLDADRYNRHGWYVSALAEYKMKNLTPGIFFWYSSGDDDNLNNGSERLPAISGNWEYTHTGFKGTNASGQYDGLLAYSPIGMWGIALQVMDISFIKSLKNHLKVLYMRGTNSANMPKKVAESQYYLTTKPNGKGTKVDGISPAGAIASYMTTNDWAMEVDLTTEYKIYDNLKLIGEVAYIHTAFDNSTWKWTGPNGVTYGSLWAQRPSWPDAFKAGVHFRYDF